MEKTLSKILIEIGSMSKRLERLTEALEAVAASGSTVREVWEEKPDMIISRADAKSWGLARYRTGEKCSGGHRGWRYVSNGCCVDCLALRAAMLKRVKSRGDVVMGEPCSKGHVGWRFVDTGACVQCDKGRLADGRLVLGGVPGSGGALGSPKRAGRKSNGKVIMGGVPGRGRR